MKQFKKDTYQKSRGGKSRFLDIRCASCGSHLLNYQKDGPGILKRLYIDRIIDAKRPKADLICLSCRKTLGIYIIYKKEERPAYRLFVGAITKKVLKQKDL